MLASSRATAHLPRLSRATHASHASHASATPATPPTPPTPCHRSFRNFGADVMLLLCGIEQADAQLGGLCASVQRLLECGMGGEGGEGGGSSQGEKLAPTLRRAAVRLLHCLASAAEILDQVRAPQPLHPLVWGWG